MTPVPQTTLIRWASQEEGQFFERKSAFHRSDKQWRQRKAADIALDIVETLSAMANADGGEVVIGIENDGEIRGVPHPPDKLTLLCNAPASQNYVHPPLRARCQEVTAANGMVFLHFEVDWSPEVHQLANGRYLMRVGDSNMPFPADQIEAIKAGKRRRVIEARLLPEATVGDLDQSLLAELRERVGLELSNEDLLLRYRLAEPRYGRLVLSLAALLLFGKDPGHWHPRCGIDFVKYEGTERLFGAELNVIRRERLEAPLVNLIEMAHKTIQPHIRERQRLVDLFFEEQLEYPPFAWQEAVVNAVAHRDYGYEGLGIEIWMFDDRIEIRSPGRLVEPVTLERLRMRERIHASRNPRIVRVLTEWGYMREQGEGIPRMFEVMEREGLYPPELRLDADVIFTVVLRNTPVYSPETLRWLRQFEPLGLSGNQKRLLAYAREHDGTFTSHAYQKLIGVDIYTASQDIKDLIRKGVARIVAKGGRAYKLMQLGVKPYIPTEFEPVLTLLQRKGRVANRDLREILGCDRSQAYQYARHWVDWGLLESRGRGRGAHYVIGPRLR